MATREVLHFVADCGRCIPAVGTGMGTRGRKPPQTRRKPTVHQDRLSGPVAGTSSSAEPRAEGPRELENRRAQALPGSNPGPSVTKHRARATTGAVVSCVSVILVAAVTPSARFRHQRLDPSGSFLGFFIHILDFDSSARLEIRHTAGLIRQSEL